MVELHNPVRERIDAGQLAIGMGLRQARTVDIAKAMKTCGYDWLFIDMEHGLFSVDDAVQISNAAQDAGVAPFVRVPGYEHYHASRVLDGGAMGVVFPHVDTPEHAATLASYCKYPPDGKRSMGGTMAQLDFATLPTDEMAAAVNSGTMVVMMIETPLAVTNADAIAAVPAVDVLLVGTNDLCLEMGIPGQIGHDRVVQAYEVIIAACKAHGKIPALGGVYTPDLMERYVGMGMQMVLGGSDMALLMAAAKERSAFLRGLQD